MKKLLAFLLVFITLSSVADELEERITSLSRGYKIHQSFDNALFLSPVNGAIVDFQLFVNENPTNIVIFMHGCSGITTEEITWVALLKDNGYHVILPNSLSIDNRPVNCDPRNKNRDLNKIAVGPLRVAESFYTLNQIRKIPSVKKIFIMGHSEGGGTITAPPMQWFNGVISTGSYCNREVNVNKDVPLLLINHTTDPFYKNGYTCKEKTVYRSNTTTEVLLPGQGHDTAYSKVANNAVLDFLKKHSEP